MRMLLQILFDVLFLYGYVVVVNDLVLIGSVIIDDGDVIVIGIVDKFEVGVDYVLVLVEMVLVSIVVYLQ